jgi:hypothetical protein
MTKLTNITFINLTLLILVSACDVPKNSLSPRDYKDYINWKTQVSFESSLKKCKKYYNFVEWQYDSDTKSFDNCYAETYIRYGGDLERPSFLIAEYKNGRISGKASGFFNSFLHLEDNGKTRGFRNLYFETEDYENNTIEYKSLKGQDLPCKVQFKSRNNSDYSFIDTYERKFICKEFTSFFTVAIGTLGPQISGDAKIKFISGNSWHLSYSNDSLVRADLYDSNGGLLFTGNYNKKTPPYGEPKNVFSVWSNLIDGEGTLKWPDGTTIVITGSNDSGDLIGIITDNNGIKYEGGIYQGLPHGKVKVTNKDGYSKTVTYVQGTELGWDMMPESQKYLTNSIYETNKSISSSANSAKRKQIWIDLNRKLCNTEFRYSTAVKDWVGYIDDIYMRDNGEIKLTIQMNGIGNKLEIFALASRFNNIVLDLKENTWSQKGSFIKFSGNLIKGKKSENECLDKNTWDNNPELNKKTFRFEISSLEALLR